MLCQHLPEFLFRSTHRRQRDATITGVTHDRTLTATEFCKLVVLHTIFELHNPIECVCVDPSSRDLQVTVAVIFDRDACHTCFCAPSQASRALHKYGQGNTNAEHGL